MTRETIPNSYSTSAVVLDNIRAEAARRHLGVAELADRAGMSKPQLYRRLRSVAQLTVADLIDLAHALDVQPGELLARPSNPNTVGYAPELSTRVGAE